MFYEAFEKDSALRGLVKEGFWATRPFRRILCYEAEKDSVVPGNARPDPAAPRRGRGRKRINFVLYEGFCAIRVVCKKDSVLQGLVRRILCYEAFQKDSVLGGLAKRILCYEAFKKDSVLRGLVRRVLRRKK